jgi:XTP/dITP diphosphohydrolase
MIAYRLCPVKILKARDARRTARGTNGFGYDPYFLIPEYHHTFGELSPVVKRHLSHRGRAFERLVPQLVRLLTAAG